MIKEERVTPPAVWTTGEKMADKMKTYKISYDKNKNMIITPTEMSPEFEVTTDYVIVGIIAEQSGDRGMIEAIEAVGILTNCVVTKIESVQSKGGV